MQTNSVETRNDGDERERKINLSRAVALIDACKIVELHNSLVRAHARSIADQRIFHPFAVAGAAAASNRQQDYCGAYQNESLAPRAHISDLYLSTPSCLSHM